MSISKPRLTSNSYTSKNPLYPKWEGECTWYAWGRFNEVHSIELPCNTSANTWFGYDFTYPVKKIEGKIKQDSVACFEYDECGHVIFIEDVYDNNEFIYTEANNPFHTDGKFYDTRDLDRRNGEDGLQAYINKYLPGGSFTGCIYSKVPGVGA